MSMRFCPVFPEALDRLPCLLLGVFRYTGVGTEARRCV